MKQYIYILRFCLLLFLLVGCEKIIDFDGKHPPKKIVLTTFVGCDSDTSFITISESSLIYDEIDFVIPEEAGIKIDINGKPCEKIWLAHSYTHEYSPEITLGFEASVKEGDVIHVSVETDKHPVVTGQETIPPPPVILDVQTEQFKHSGYDDYLMRALIRIKDDPAISNYYRLLIKLYESDDWWGYIDYYIDQDLVMSSLSSQEIQDGEDTNRMRIFPDDLFNGKEYTLNVYFWDPFYYENKERQLIIEVQALSESMYLYLRSLEMSSNSDIFSEPVRIYSNIKGGYGVVGTYNSAVKIIKDPN
ncbi:MAG: DUF4249 domain-containing protein [Tannerellaceae bacterium]|nr:DUF4249 domain-containing protein [Tannerellaceae bacterium]